MSAHDDSASFSKTLFGFWTFLMSDFILFAAIFATYAVLHNNTNGGPPAGEIFSLSFALAATLLLLTSSFTFGPALLAAQNEEKNKTLLWLSLSFVLGILFLGFEMQEFTRLVQEGNSWERSAFLSAFFNLVGTHALHVAVGLLWMVVLMVHLVRRGFTPVLLKRLSCLRLFWHFVNIIWVFIYTVVYLMGGLSHV